MILPCVPGRLRKSADFKKKAFPDPVLGKRIRKGKRRTGADGTRLRTDANRSEKVTNRVKNLKGNALLVLAALIWGVAFVAQDKAAEVVPTFTMNTLRSFIASIVLVPLIAFMQKRKGKPFLEKEPLERKKLWTGGLVCGIFLCIAANFQQFGIAAYPADAAASGRSGFITAMYVVLVPIFGLATGKIVPHHVRFGVILAAVGMGLLCLSGGVNRLYWGDLFVLCCAFVYTFQVLAIDKYARLVDGLKLSCLQFLVCGVLSAVLMLFFEQPNWAEVLSAWPYVLYVAVMSSGVAYTLQIIGQGMSENPTVASICMSLESVFAMIAGAILMHERFTAREGIGVIMMFAAILLSQMPEKWFAFRKKTEKQKDSH